MESEPNLTADTTVTSTEEIPNYIIISLARLLLPEIRDYYSSVEGKENLSMCENEKVKVNP